MKNPFRSEAEAYRFLIGTVVYFVAIAVATALGGRWVGLAVFVVLSVLVLVWFFRRETQEQPPASAPRPHAGDERRILVVANETVGGPELRDAIRAAAGERRASVLVVITGAEHEAQALGLRRGPGARGGGGASGPQRGRARAARLRGRRRGG